MSTSLPSTFSAYHQGGCLIQGNLPAVALATSRFLANNIDQQVLILEDSTCQIVDLDLSSDETLLQRKADYYPVSALRPAQHSDQPRSAAVTLLPRHWQWLKTYEMTAGRLTGWEPRKGALSPELFRPQVLACIALA